MKFRPIIILLTVIASIYGCGKASDAPIASNPATYLNVINTSADTLNYYLNGTRQNSQSSLYAGGATGYLSLQSGTQNYQFKKFASTSILFTLPLTLNTLKHDTTIDNVATTQYLPLNYTLYVTGETADKAFLRQDTLVTNSDNCTVRFAHTADGTPPLDVTVSDVSFTNRSYGTVSAFKVAATGTNKIITVSLAGSSTPIITQKFNLLTGDVYTLYVKGLPAGTGKSALTVGVFANQQ
jgi:hypothetical protein